MTASAAGSTTDSHGVSIETVGQKSFDNKVADMSLAAFGRKEIELAEVEMPGLMACRQEFGLVKPFTVNQSKLKPAFCSETLMILVYS